MSSPKIEIIELYTKSIVKIDKHLYHVWKYKTGYRTGYEEWQLDGKIHREDGPAVKLVNGTEIWYKNGERHREDGPAIKHPDGREEYWIKGKSLSKEQFESRFKRVR